MRKRSAKNGLGLLVALAVPAVAEPAHAYEAEVNADTAAQFYALSSPYGSPLVARRRYTQTLGLSVYDLQGDYVPFGPTLSFKARLRLDADFGQQDVERDPASGRYVPGLQQAPVDIMYAYLEGKNYLGGLMGFRIGRQYVTDSLGWWSFDGGLVRITTPAFVQAEAYGGFEQRGGIPIMLGTERFSADGVYRGNRRDLEFNQYPYFLQESKLAPAYGVAIESTGVNFLHSRLTYRKVINRDTVVMSPFADPGYGLTRISGDRVSSERLGYSLRADHEDIGALRGALVYDFYNQLVSERALAADWYTTEEITVGADYDYYYPTFDADSIFNWFAHSGITTLQGRGEWRPWRRFDVSAAAGARRFETEGNSGTYGTVEQQPASPDRTDSGHTTDFIGNLGSRFRWTDGSVGLRSMAETGRSGHRVGGDVTTQQLFDNGFYDSLFVVSLYDWDDSLRPDRSATSFAYVLGGGVRPFEGSRFGLEWEHAMNRLVGQRFRVLATLAFTVLR